MASIEYYSTGRRKTSTARVFLRPGSGTITVNHREFDKYFTTDQLRTQVRSPLLLTETAFIRSLAPGLLAHLRDPAGRPLPGSVGFVYWSKEDFEIRPVLRIVEGGNDAGRLVKRVVERRGRRPDAFAVDFDAVFDRIRLRPELADHRAVDRNAALQDPALRFAPRSQAGASEDLLEPLHGASLLLFQRIERDCRARYFW